MHVTIAKLDDIWGYGLEAVGADPEDALRALKREFYAGRRSDPYARGHEWYTFREACEYFGLNLITVKVGTAYWLGMGAEDAEYLDVARYGFEI